MILLCYHKVGPAAEEGRRLNIEPASLRRQVRWLRRRGGQFIHARELARPWPSRGVCLTFDDGYVSTLTHGVEALLAEGAVGSIYAVADLVGRSSEWDKGNERPLADWRLLLDAQAKGIEIGNHTCVHPHLGNMALAEQAAEIGRAHEVLTANGIDSQSFCLPYGSHNAETSEAVAQTGYEVGLALRKRLPRPDDDRRLLPRIVVAYSDGVVGLIYKLKVKPLLKRYP